MMGYDDPDIGADPAVASMEILVYFDNLANERRANPQDDIVTKPDQCRPRRRPRRADERRVRLLRHPADRRGQRDHPQRDQPRHARLLRAPRPVGACGRRSGPRRPSTRSSAGRRR
ncbi:hypothetical protein [Nocardioides convexus]|uniref:hypothetical protein n=1 Tax=Nocardioides convexus TaxID=2712224 RepID=UPI002418B181|nr:hypothetical protein [Nocardioides convexus]